MKRIHGPPRRRVRTWFMERLLDAGAFEPSLLATCESSLSTWSGEEEGAGGAQEAPCLHGEQGAALHAAPQRGGGEGRGRSRGWGCLLLPHLEETTLAAAGDPALLAVPGGAFELDVVRDGNLLAVAHGVKGEGHQGTALSRGGRQGAQGVRVQRQHGVPTRGLQGARQGSSNRQRALSPWPTYNAPHASHHILRNPHNVGDAQTPPANRFAKIAMCGELPAASMVLR